MSYKLMSTILRANTSYFVKQGWEQPETLDRLERWLNGNTDTELSKKIESWFLSDAKWTKEILPDMVRHFWYIAPVVWFVTAHMHRLLLKWVKEVASGKYPLSN